MKKRQLLIYMLVGALVFSSTPFTVFGEEATEENVAAVLSEEGIGEPVADTPAVEENKNTFTGEIIVEGTVTEDTVVEGTGEEDTKNTGEEVSENTNVTPTEIPMEDPSAFTSVVETPEASGEAEINAVAIQDVETISEEANTSQATAPFYIGETAYETLEAAIAAVPDTDSINDECTQIKVYLSEWKLSSTIVIPEKKNICFVAAAETVTITREAGFTGVMFQVEGGVLNFVKGEVIAEDGSSKTETKFVLDGTSDSSLQYNSMILVKSGVFAIGENVSLKNNVSSGKGGAIYNEKDGIVYLIGGMISENTAVEAGGGVYSEGVLYVQGNPVVSGNKDAQQKENNIVLSGDDALIYVTGILSNSEEKKADLKVSKVDGIEGSGIFVIAENTEGVIAADVLAVLTYEGSDGTLEIGEDGKLKTAASKDDESNGSTGSETSRDPIISEVANSTISGLEDALYFYPTSERSGKYSSYSFHVTGAGTEITEPVTGDVQWRPAYWSYSASPADADKNTTWTITTSNENSTAGTHTLYVFFDKYEYNGSEWVAANMTESAIYTYQSRNLFYLTGVSYKWRSQTEVDVTFHTNKAAKYYVEAVVRGASQPSPVESNFIDMAADTDLTITVTNLEVGTEYDIYVYAIDKDGGISSGVKFQPAESSRPSSVITREPYTPAVTESVVTGLEKALEFYPNTFYPFTVVGAGTDNTDPVEGDVKWVPVYWSTSSNPSSSQKHTTWKIGAAAGISQAATYNMYIFYQKYYYTGLKWEATDTISSVAYQFKSAEIEITVTPDQTESTGGYYDEDGNYVSYNGTSGDGTSNTTNIGDTTTASTVKTADNTPLGSFLAMFMSSMAAVFYVFTRKRKNIEK